MRAAWLAGSQANSRAASSASSSEPARAQTGVCRGISHNWRPNQSSASLRPRPIRPPTRASSAASPTNSARTCAGRAPRALSKPISAVRWFTAIQVTFMIRMPATSRLIAAIPANARLRTSRMPSNAASIESWLIRVTSSLPSWRALMVSRICRLPLARKCGPRSSANTRNSPSRLNSTWALATGMISISPKSMPSDSPRSPRIPTTRKRRSPARSHSPRAGPLPNNSRLRPRPITQTASA
ncbi:hypothetical protein D3C85_486580 [compost metagenome]